MDNLEPKKLALIRIWQILKEYSDYDHPLTQEDISRRLENDYGITIERKTIGRNISLLREAGADIESTRGGSYLRGREFEDSELHMLIDGVLSSRYITATHSKDLIDRLCGLSSRYFRSSVRHIYSVNDWSKTDNQELFYNIEVAGDAIESGRQLRYDYNKYGADKKLHKSSEQQVSPYLMVLHNQRYYLMGCSEYWNDIVFHRLDHITNIVLTDEKATPLKEVEGYENGINYKDFASAMPYMYTDRREHIEFEADASIIDQIVDWFGTDIRIMKTGDDRKVVVSLKASPQAMEYWAMQYINHVEILRPESLRTRVTEALESGLEKYRCQKENQ
ncbi:MAG: transcriptional regulator [Anaerovoracaceae bacterium]|nr:transcriptional regulator [Anaerovoracaceae bacterium]